MLSWRAPCPLCVPVSTSFRHCIIINLRFLTADYLYVCPHPASLLGQELVESSPGRVCIFCNLYVSRECLLTKWWDERGQSPIHVYLWSLRPSVAPRLFIFSLDYSSLSSGCSAAHWNWQVCHWEVRQRGRVFQVFDFDAVCLQEKLTVQVRLLGGWGTRHTKVAWAHSSSHNKVNRGRCQRGKRKGGTCPSQLSALKEKGASQESCWQGKTERGWWTRRWRRNLGSTAAAQPPASHPFRKGCSAPPHTACPPGCGTHG